MKTISQGSLTQSNGNKMDIQEYMRSEGAQNMLMQLVKSPDAAEKITSDILFILGQNEKLKSCARESIITSAVQAYSMKLSLTLGQASVVPYGSQARFSVSARGYKQLAMRSMSYEDIDVYDVREGEYKGRDPRTRRPVFEWIEDDEERESKPIIGYYGFYMLNKDYGNFFKCIYWSRDKVLKHADRYAPGFSLEKYNNRHNLSPEALKALQSGSPWYGEPDSEAHFKMCAKTLYLQMLRDGFAPLSIEMQSALSSDNEERQTAEDFYANSGSAIVFGASDTPVTENVIDIPSEPSASPVESVSAEVVKEPAKAKKTTQKSTESVRDNDLPFFDSSDDTQVDGDDPFLFG